MPGRRASQILLTHSHPLELVFYFWHWFMFILGWGSALGLMEMLAKGPPLWEFCLCSISYMPQPVRFFSGSDFCNAECGNDKETGLWSAENRQREENARGHIWVSKGGGGEFRGRDSKGRRPHSSLRKWYAVRREARRFQQGYEWSNMLWSMQSHDAFL